MNNEIEIFSNEEFGKIRVTTNKIGEPIFCLKDVCDVLDLKQASKVKERLNQKGVHTIPTLTRGGTQNLLYINESNLYRTIFQSRKEEAERFQDWVTNEVLPSVRKNGFYGTPEKIEEILNNPRNFLRTLEAYAEEKEKNKVLRLENNELKEENKMMKPKSDYFDKLIDKELLLSFRDSSKELKIKQKEFIDFLLDKKIIYRDKNKRLRPYARYVDKGYFEIKEGLNNSLSYSQTFITVKGREYFIRLLKKHNIID